MAGKTEWEDMLIKLGHMEAPPQQEKVDVWKLEGDGEAERVREERLEYASLDELDELEDDEDDRVLEAYRRKRMDEMKQAALKNKYGEVINISEQEWKDQVTNAPQDEFVVVNLYKQGVPQSRLLDQIMTQLAKKFKATKFVRIRAEEAIHGYPDKNIPTILVYHKGDVHAQMVTLSALSGDDTTAQDLEWRLAKLNVIQSDLEEDPKKQKKSSFSSYLGQSGRGYDDED